MAVATSVGLIHGRLISEPVLGECAPQAIDLFRSDSPDAWEVATQVLNRLIFAVNAPGVVRSGELERLIVEALQNPDLNDQCRLHLNERLKRLRERMSGAD